MLTQYLYQNQKTDLISFEVLEDDMRIHLNKENLMKEGYELITKFLLILQTSKNSDCIERDAAFFLQQVFES